MNLKIFFVVLLLCYANVSNGRSFSECDIDNDLRLNKDEVSRCQLELDFKMLDLNSDRFLDKSELKANR
jgi:hypothetical protein